MSKNSLTTKYCVRMGNDYVSHNGSFKFSYEKAEFLLEDKKAYLKGKISKEKDLKNMIELQELMDTLKIEIYEEH